MEPKELESDPVRTYHRIIEAFKFAYKYRSMLADPDYERGVNKVRYDVILLTREGKICQLIRYHVLCELTRRLKNSQSKSRR